MENYRATFSISCGISSGFAVKSPHHEERQETIGAESPVQALYNAMHKAREFAQDYLSNPDDDMTTVTLRRLQDSQGRELSQADLLERIGVRDHRVSFENDSVVYRCSQAEHILRLALE